MLQHDFVLETAFAGLAALWSNFYVSGHCSSAKVDTQLEGLDKGHERRSGAGVATSAFWCCCLSSLSSVGVCLRLSAPVQQRTEPFAGIEGHERVAALPGLSVSFGQSAMLGYELFLAPPSGLPRASGKEFVPVHFETRPT